MHNKIDDLKEILDELKVPEVENIPKNLTELESDMYIIEEFRKKLEDLDKEKIGTPQKKSVRIALEKISDKQKLYKLRKINEELDQLPNRMNSDSDLPITTQKIEEYLIQINELTNGAADYSPKTLEKLDIDTDLTESEKSMPLDIKQEVRGILLKINSAYSSYNFYQMIHRGKKCHEIPAKLAIKSMYYFEEQRRYLDAIDAIHTWLNEINYLEVDNEVQTLLIQKSFKRIIDKLIEFHKDRSGAFYEVNKGWEGTSDMESEDYEFDERVRNAPLIHALNQFLSKMSMFHFNSFDVVSLSRKVKRDGEKEFALATLDEIEKKIRTLDGVEMTVAAENSLSETLKEIERMRNNI